MQVVGFLGKTLLTLSLCFSPTRCINGKTCNGLASHPGRGRNTPSHFMECFRNRDKLRSDGALGSNTDSTYLYLLYYRHFLNCVLLETLERVKTYTQVFANEHSASPQGTRKACRATYKGGRGRTGGGYGFVSSSFLGLARRLHTRRRKKKTIRMGGEGFLIIIFFPGAIVSFLFIFLWQRSNFLRAS